MLHLMKIIVLGIILAGSATLLKAQCVSVGPRVGTSTSNNTSIGNIGWTTVANSVGSDDSYSTASAVLIGDKTNYLIITDFGFTLPSFVPICGIVVEVEAGASGFLQNITDNSVRLVVGGAVTGNNKALGSSWAGSDTYRTFGSNSDKWGTSVTYSDVNAGNFGVAISANLTSLSALPTARIDNVRVTIHYDNTTLPIQLLDFEASRKEQAVQLKWNTASEQNNDYFEIERSLDGENWDRITSIDGAGNSGNLLNYQFLDSEAPEARLYYRLKQVDFNGNFSYSSVVTVDDFNDFSDEITVSNPFREKLTITIRSNGNLNTFSIVLKDMLNGNVVFSEDELKSGKFVKDLSSLENGTYVLTVSNGKQVTKNFKLIKMN